MGILELLIVVLLLLWAFGYFGAAHLAIGAPIAGNNLIHVLLVIVLILVIVRFLR
jgi:hypothetical protein